MLEIVALIVAVGLVIAIAMLLRAAMKKPHTFHVQRSTIIAAAPEIIFALIEDFSKWGAWSPYEKKDPTMKRAFAGPPSGQGSRYAWLGDKSVGAGRMEITEATAPSKVVLKLDMLKPIEAHNIVEFTLVPQGDGTQVTWAMHGPAPLFSRIMQVFFNIDKMIGADMEEGLTDMETAAEK